MLARRSDLQLEGDAAGRFLPWVIAVMVFLAALALAGGLGLGKALAGWDQSLKGSLTAQIVDAGGTPAPEKVQAALVLLSGTPGVEMARALDRHAVEALLEPWLGQANLTPDLPIPTLIEVRLEPGASLSTAALARRLEAAVPGARLDDDRTWLAPLIHLTEALRALAAGIVVLVGLATIAMVIFATRAGLAVHREVIAVLHLIGAHDGYIARQFQSHTLWLALKGGLPGLAAAALVLLALRGLGGGMQAALLPPVTLGTGAIAALVLVPLVAALLAVLTARFTVLGTLRQMP